MLLIFWREKKNNKKKVFTKKQKQNISYKKKKKTLHSYSRHYNYYTHPLIHMTVTTDVQYTEKTGGGRRRWGCDCRGWKNFSYNQFYLYPSITQESLEDNSTMRVDLLKEYRKFTLQCKIFSLNAQIIYLLYLPSCCSWVVVGSHSYDNRMKLWSLFLFFSFTWSKVNSHFQGCF